MRHVGPVRRGLGVTTIMNVLGPLTNPAGARRQVIGVADERLLELIALALKELGHLRALVVHGSPGMDEVSPVGPTKVAELQGGDVQRYELSLDELGVVGVEATALAGGDPEANAAIITSVLGGERGAARTAVLLNAAAALRVADRAESWPEAVALAETAIDEGRAMGALDALRDATGRG
jgi:anthranilate phosphoribosyltransferase